MADGKVKYKSHWNRNSKQQRAQDQLRKEVKAGRIIKPDVCEVCGGGGQLIGHHWRGYDAPLDVWWICVSCNVRLDKHDGSVSLLGAKIRMAKKTDNADPAAKLALWRHFLRKYHADDPAHVLDCCQGGGLLWGQLRREFDVATYWGVDTKPKRGRLRLDSVRILSLPGWPQNVIDVDTYGSPWKHWEALLPRISRPTTVFLTIGQRQMGTDKRILGALGLGGLKVPAGIACKIHGIALSWLLTRGCVYSILLVEAVEAVSTGNARYVGVRLEPGKT